MPSECGEPVFGVGISGPLYEPACNSTLAVLSDDVCAQMCSECPACSAWATDSPSSDEGLTCWLTSGPAVFQRNHSTVAGLPCRGAGLRRWQALAPAARTELVKSTASSLGPDAEMPAWRSERCGSLSDDKDAGGDFVVHVGRNCFPGQGADVFGEDNGAGGEIGGRSDFSLEECRQRCWNRMPTCEAFARLPSDGPVAKCWLRTNVHLQKCWYGTDFNFWLWDPDAVPNGTDAASNGSNASNGTAQVRPRGDCSRHFSDPLATARVRWLESLGPGRFGVNVHFMNFTEPPPGEIAQLAEAFRIARMDLFWRKIEKERRGVYNWTRIDVLVDRFLANGVRPLFILDYGNPLYKGCAEHPFTGECREAFVLYATAAMRRYRGRGVIWELYNEPNGFWANYGQFRHESIVGYADLLNRLGRAVREDEEIAAEVLIGPATSGVDLDWIESVGATGAFQWLDGISVHPYRKEGPESAYTVYRKLRSLVRNMIPAEKAEPALVSSEWGWAACRDDDDVPIKCPSQGGGVGDVVSLRTQASRLVRQWLVNDMSHIALSIWYNWRNDGHDPREAEMNYGSILAADEEEEEANASATWLPRQRKPVFFAARNFQKFVAPRRFKRAFGNAAKTRVYALHYEPTPGGPDGDVFVLWQVAGLPRRIEVPFKLNACMAVVSLLSDHLWTMCPDGGTNITVTEDPLYFVPCDQSPFGSCVPNND